MPSPSTAHASGSRTPSYRCGSARLRHRRLSRIRPAKNKNETQKAASGAASSPQHVAHSFPFFAYMYIYMYVYIYNIYIYIYVVDFLQIRYAVSFF